LIKVSISVDKTDSANLASFLMFSVGILLIVASTAGFSTTFALMGMSLTFWGALLRVVYVSSSVS
jgi:hypothetical protein